MGYNKFISAAKCCTVLCGYMLSLSI